MSVPYSLASSVYKFACPKCKAEAGKLCVRLRGKSHPCKGAKLPELSAAHRERWLNLQPELPLEWEPNIGKLRRPH